MKTWEHLWSRQDLPEVYQLVSPPLHMQSQVHTHPNASSFQGDSFHNTNSERVASTIETLENTPYKGDRWGRHENRAGRRYISNSSGNLPFLLKMDVFIQHRRPRIEGIRIGGVTVILTIKNDTLYVGEGKHSFENTIGTIIALDDLVIVRLFKEKDGECNMAEQTVNNVYALSANGDVLWNIREIIDFDNWVTDIGLDEDNLLQVFTFIGIMFKIDPRQKRILKRVVTK